VCFSGRLKILNNYKLLEVEITNNRMGEIGNLVKFKVKIV
jgi:hypothetical protein